MIDLTNMNYLNIISTVPAALCINKKGNVHVSKITGYARTANGEDRLFLFHNNSLPGPPGVLVQYPHIFDQNKTQLQCLNDINIIVLVLNGRKSMTLLNFLHSKEI